MPHGISYVWTLKYNINELVYGTEMDLQRQKTEQTPGCQGGGWERNAAGLWGQQIQTIIYRMDKQQGPTVLHREMYSKPL